MARQRRQTEPQETLQGLLVSYMDIEPLLIEAEICGRYFAFQQAKLRTAKAPDDYEIYALHKAMFEAVFEWAGQPRVNDKGPGGVVHVPWTMVRQEMRQFCLNLESRVQHVLSRDSDLGDMAEVIAWAHHKFQYIHPFSDTNGRTGRVLDHYLLWATFRLAGETVETSPIIEPFPTEQHQDDYYEGLQLADTGRLEKLNTYYTERIVQALARLEPSDSV